MICVYRQYHSRNQKEREIEFRKKRYFPQGNRINQREKREKTILKDLLIKQRISHSTFRVKQKRQFNGEWKKQNFSKIITQQKKDGKKYMILLRKSQKDLKLVLKLFFGQF
ncbi:unnamed protein product [Paramecium sonneborni]|uniref:Uncharacterized protein n=1 Tax=Paramecium sonneborni TaxID=65129 RepID=A0A8S1RJH8_9CILI|nr:unnamed protein product [Paramecium sonneborni]